MTNHIVFLIVLLFSSVSLSLDQDFSGAFIAAGFENVDGEWLSECGKESRQADFQYQPASIDQMIDLNGDNNLELIITEGGGYCAGNTGVVSYILTKMDDGQWREVVSFTGMPKVLTTKGGEGWFDIMIGGPGFCFEVKSYQDGKYTFSRMEYNGKPCKR